MSFLANDHGEVALVDQSLEFSMCDLYQGAGRIKDTVALLTPSVAITVGSTVSGDDDIGCRGRGPCERTFSSTLLRKAGFHHGIMRKLTEDGGGLPGEEGFRSLNSLANAKAHP